MWMNNRLKFKRLQPIVFITLFVLRSNSIAQADEWIWFNRKLPLNTENTFSWSQ